MKRFLLTLLSLALVAAFAAFVLTPVVTRQRRLRDNAKVVADYQAAADGLSLLDCGTMMSQVQDYNQALGAAWTDPYAPDAADPGQTGGGDSYASLLNPAGDGVMAVLDVPKLGVSLPVYHGGGAEASVARVEHAPQSQLPSDGAGELCVLRATRERFFDPFRNLDRLIAGDCFFLRVLQETTTYEVFQVATVSPRELAELRINGDDDECALVAESAAGDRGARLVVRGRRVPRQSVRPADDSKTLPGGVPELIIAAPIAAVGLVLLAIVECFRRAARRHKRRRTKL